MKKILLSLLAFCCTTCIFADVVTFDFTENDYFPTLGESSGSGDSYVADGDITEPVTATESGYSITISAAAEDASTPNRIWATAPKLRMYSGTLTVTAPEGVKMKSVTFNLATAKSSAKWGSENSVNVGSVALTESGTSAVWTGEAESFVLTVAKNTQIRTIEISTEVTEPEPEPSNALLEESFADSIGSFTIDDKVLPEGLTYVWKHDGSYKQMKASAYANSTKYAAESWLVSPVVDATNHSAIVLNFDHTGKYFGTMADEATLWVREEGGEYAQVEIPTYMTGSDWTFVTATVDLSAFNNKKFQFAFKYVSTADAAPTWEVKNVVVTSDTGISAINAEGKKSTVKRIENGHLVIEKNGKQFNAAGQLIK